MDYRYKGNVIGVEGRTMAFPLPIGLGYETKGFALGIRYMLLDEDFNNFSITGGLQLHAVDQSEAHIIAQDGRNHSCLAPAGVTIASLPIVPTHPGCRANLLNE